MSTIIEHHAQKSQIIEDMLAGIQGKTIAEKYNVPKGAVYRYIDSRLKPAMAAVNPLGCGAPATISKTNTTEIADKSLSELALEKRTAEIGNSRLGLAAQFAQKIARNDHLRQAMLEHTFEEKDARGFAAVDQRVVGSIETQARLLGVLQDAAPAGPTFAVQINNGVTPTVVPTGDFDEPSTIDIAAQPE